MESKTGAFPISYSDYSLNCSYLERGLLKPEVLRKASGGGLNKALNNMIRRNSVVCYSMPLNRALLSQENNVLQ